MEKNLAKIYFDAKHPAGFSSAYKLYKAAKQDLPKLTLTHVKKWLSAQETYTLHRELKRKFPRRKTITSGLNYQWQSDLAVFDGIARYNRGIRYLLICINCFSRYLIVRPLKKKDSASMVAAFKDIFKTYTVPINLQSDQGTEYFNRPLQEYLRKKGVNHFSTYSIIKASFAERIIRTLKEKIFKYFTYKNTLKYIDVLPSIVHAYNHTVHSSINIAPAKVSKKNERKLWKAQYSSYLKQVKTSNLFKPGDHVRLTKIRKEFKKGYLPKWTQEIFIIVDQIHTNPPVWRIMDNQNQIILGTFYAPELQLVS